jgi:hypothetical protein
MSDEDLLQRIKCLYASIKMLQEFDIGKFPAKITQNERMRAIFQDFSGGASKEDFHNNTIIAIHNLANFRDHIKKWARESGKDPARVEEIFEGSLALKLIQDLSDKDKHAYPKRDGGYSKKDPTIRDLRKSFRMKTGAEKGSKVSMTFNSDGSPHLTGNGTGLVITTGDVIDKDSKRIGDLLEIELDAVLAWESLLNEWEISSNPQTSF